MSDHPTHVEAGSETWLTPEGYQRMKEELHHLTMVKRPEIADRIRDSQQHGEFSEDNSELDEVKFEQAMVENRIGDLKMLFSTARILEPDNIPTDRVGIGSFVKVRDTQYGEEFEVRIVCSVESDPDRDYISNESPMGSSLLGSAVGQHVTVEAPLGRQVYDVLEIRRA